VRIKVRLRLVCEDVDLVRLLGCDSCSLVEKSFYLEDWGSSFLRNVGKCITEYMAAHPTIQSAKSLLLGLKI